MRNIQITALVLTLGALSLLALLQSQASNSAAPAGGVLFFVALIAVPMCAAAAVFSTISSIKLRTRRAREAHGYTNRWWRLLFVVNVLLSLGYLTIVLIMLFG